jgi:oligopeptide/dipeptide ABC transporter ATP-binding protein
VVAETCDRVIVMYAGQVFEEGPVDDVFRNPQNPYTEGLLRSIPRLGGETRRLAVIPGVVPSPLAWPSGCRFHERCPYGWEKTEREEPPLFEIGPGRKNKCWLVEHPERREEIRRQTGGFTPQGALTGTGAATTAAGDLPIQPDAADQPGSGEVAT